jgi:hypothetical protein
MTHFHQLNAETYYPAQPPSLEQPSDLKNPAFPWWVPGNQWVSIAWFGGIHVITRRTRL